MIEVNVILKNEGVPGDNIKMSIEEYSVFIERQAGLLGILKQPKLLMGIDTSESKDFSIIMPKSHGKSSVDEIIKEINKIQRRK